MPQNRTLYLAVGTFVLAMVTALVVTLITVAGKNTGTSAYFLSLPNVAGLKFGTPVLFEGYLAGQLEHITPTIDANERFELKLSISDDIKIPSDSQVFITQPNLLSGRAISISSGVSLNFVQANEFLNYGGNSGLALLPDLIGDGQDLLSDSRHLVQELAESANLFRIWLEEDFRSVASTYAELPLALENEVIALGDEAQMLVSELRQASHRASTILDEDTLSSVRKTVENVEETTTKLKQSSERLDRLNQDIQSIVTLTHDFMSDSKPDLESAIIDLRYALERVSVRIDSMTYNLEGTSQNMYEFTREIRLNPALLLGGKPPQDEAVSND